MTLQLGAVVVLGVAMWAAIVFFIPSCTASFFRYSAWRVRDNIVDDVFNGTLPDHPAVWDVVESAEALIVTARELSMAKVAGFSWAFRGSPPRPRPSRSGLSDAQKKRLRDDDHQLQRSLALYLSFGTPTGWVAVPFLAVWFIALEMKPRKYRRRSAAHMVERRVARPVVTRTEFWEETLISENRRDGVLEASM